MKFWNIATEPSYDNIEALVFGSFILMEDCHMFRTWTCIGLACRLLQDAGFHRQASLAGLPTDEKRHRKWLFWTAYSFDHALSLNFGRTPNVQNWDITVELPDFPPEAHLVSEPDYFRNCWRCACCSALLHHIEAIGPPTCGHLPRLPPSHSHSASPVSGVRLTN